MTIEAVDLSDKVCMVTGASSGIGQVSALALAKMGAELYLLCRNRDKGERTVAELQAATGNQRIALFTADFSSLAEVRQAATRFLAMDRPLHLLLNNAGVVNSSRRLSADGYEEMFAVNHLAPFLLTRLLQEKLCDSAPARIVNVASGAHMMVRGINFADLNHERGFRFMGVYGHSKLANILFNRELARRLAGSGVTANALHPGEVATGLGAQNGWFGRSINFLMKLFLASPEKGARTSIYVSTSPALEGVSGKYFARCQETLPRPWATDDDAARRLWQCSEEMTAEFLVST